MNQALDHQVIEGEIIGPNDTVRFFVFKFVLQSDREIHRIPAGMTIRESLDYTLALMQERPPSKLAFYLQDGTRIPEDMWDRVRLKPNTAVIARPIAEAPIFAIFAAISSITATVSAFFAGMGIFGQILLTGLTMAAKFLISKLFMPKPPKPDVSDAIPFYSITGSRNEIMYWAPIPLLLGRYRITPPLAASPYTEVVGDEQYLRQLFCNGYGPLALEETTAKIGETLVSSYKEEAEIEHRPGNSVTEPNTTLYPKSVIDEPFSIELKKADPNTIKRTATDTVQVALDFMWPQGLCNIDDEGNRRDRDVTIKMQHKKVGTTTWVNMPTLTFEEDTQKVIRKTVTFTLPSEGQYDILVHKESPEPPPEFEDWKWVGLDQVMYTAIRSYRTGEPVTFSDAPLSFTAIRIRASGRLNQIIDTYNIVATSRVTAWNGTAWVANTASRRPPDLFRWVLQCGANRRPYATSKIDLPALQAWHAYCVAQGWFYDKWVVDQVSVYDLLI